MGRPAGARDPKLAAMLASEATPARLRAFCRAQYLAWFGEPWDPSLRSLLLSVDDCDEPLAKLALAPSIRARKKKPSQQARAEAAERRQLRVARTEVGRAISDVVRSARAARRAFTRLRGAAREASELAEKWKTELVVEIEGAGDYGAALATGVDVLEDLLAKLPANLDADRPPRRIEPRTLVAERALGPFERAPAPRELAIVGILAGVAVQMKAGETVAALLERERVNYAQTLTRLRRARRSV